MNIDEHWCKTMKKSKGRRSVLETIAVLLCFLTFPLFHPALAGAQETIEQALLSIRQATGYDVLQQWNEGLYVEASGEYLGLPSAFQMYFLPQGLFRTEITSDLTLIEGFDGQRGWMVDETGMPGHLELMALEQSQLMAWTTGGFWLDPKCPLNKDLYPWSESDSVIVFSLLFPSGILTATMTIDSRSFLPQRCVWKTFGQENYIAFDRYEDGGGFLFPGEISFSVESYETRLETQMVRLSDSALEHLCVPVTTRPQDTRFVPGKKGSVELKKISSGHLAVRPLVNGQDFGWFLLDTGAGRSVLDRSIADRLGMEVIAESPAMGFGGLVTVRYRRGQLLTLGPLEIDEPTFLGIDLAPLAGAFGCDIAGILGYDLFMRCLVELDVQSDSLLLFEPGTWGAREADWQEIIFNRNAPTLSCSFSGDHTALFDLDTGFPGMVTFNRAFAAKHGLFDEQESEAFTAGGVGGNVEMVTAQLEWLELHGHRWENLAISIAGEAHGVLSDESVAGLVGTGLLASYRTLIDYPNKRIAFEEKK
ncbi:pepsin/retropepsin-like aspartic protease family protein [Candidatus Zixiibacteriota bacterium]